MKIKTNCLLILIILVVALNYFGIVTFIFEEDFDTNFDYPLNIDILPLIEQLRNNEIPSVPPINTYNYTFLKSCEEKCKGSTSLELVIIIKSAMSNSERRLAIRNTFGNENRFENVFFKTVFLLGVNESSNNYELQEFIDKESNTFEDIIQANFIDSYFNNTIKTMMGLKWVVNYCPVAKFYYFSDDDMYVSVKNLLIFVQNPSHYPMNKNELDFESQKKVLQIRSVKESSAILEVNNSNLTRLVNSNEKNDAWKNIQNHYQNDIKNGNDVVLFAGLVIKTSPYRNRNSKWYVSLKEYHWHKWPPFIPAGAYVLSNKALITLYYGSFYTAHFRLDDVYLAIIAKKCGITPFNCEEFYNHKKQYNVNNYRYVIASHGYSDSLELLQVWNEQRRLGHA